MTEEKLPEGRKKDGAVKRRPAPYRQDEKDGAIEQRVAPYIGECCL